MRSPIIEKILRETPWHVRAKVRIGAYYAVWKHRIAKALFLALCCILAGCGPSYHLKRAKYHQARAIAKGAVVTVDTVYKEIKVLVPSVKVDTVFHDVHDTVTIEKERIRIRYVKLPGDSVYIEGECKADTVKVEVPCPQNVTISAPEPVIKWWWLIVAVLLGGAVVRIWGR